MKSDGEAQAGRPQATRAALAEGASGIAALETRGLTIAFGGQLAVDAVSCAFHPGTLTAIVGPNGAGKTTYLNLISGQLRPTGGTVHLFGRDVTALGAAQRVHLGVGRTFQLTNLYPNLSVLENVRLGVQSMVGHAFDMHSIAARASGLSEEARRCLRRVGLEGKEAALAATLPHGDQRRLEIAIVLALKPRILLLDEPTAGMSFDQVPIVLSLIEEIARARDTTILMVEHRMDAVRRLADRVVVMQDGRLVADGTPAQVAASPEVQRAYLGLTPSDSPGPRAPASPADAAGATGL
jgi:branched-chain amino acid transport system ATP-binding protein